MGLYSESSEWADIIPIPQDDGGLNPLAAIAYPDEYSEAMSYLRALMAKNEKSERALRLTVDIIEMNPAHYTVWLYRASVLLALKMDLLKELAWLNEVSRKHLKNYQIWHHRQTVVSHIATLPESEIPFLSFMFSLDAKNYHVWSYRQWLVRHFSLWDSEIPTINALLTRDVYNNSAWNHRWFVLFCRRADPTLHSIKASWDVFSPEDKHLVEEEIIYVKEKIYVAPQNQSPWTYLRAILRHTSTPLSNLISFAEGFVTPELLLLFHSNDNNNNNDNNNDNNDNKNDNNKKNDDGKENQIKSSHALDLLADAYAEQGENEKSGKVLEYLGAKADPIRRNYWEFKRRGLGLVGGSA